MFMRCASRRAPYREYSYIRGTINHSGRYKRYQSTTEPSTKTASLHKDARRYGKGSFFVGVFVASAIWIGYQYYMPPRAHDSFLHFELAAKEPISSTASVFHLRPRDSSLSLKTYEEAWRAGIWNFHFKQPQLQIVRAYTPLPPMVQEDLTNELRFLIRNDPHGEMSNYLHRLPLGANIELRGPNLEYHITPKVQRVVFYAGGTGIAPALQVANALLGENGDHLTPSNQSRPTRNIHILWANKKREDCMGGVNKETDHDRSRPQSFLGKVFSKSESKQLEAAPRTTNSVVSELNALQAKYPGQVSVEYFIDEESSFINDAVVHRSLQYLDQSDEKNAGTFEEQQIIISGPDGFISYLAGPKEWRNGKEEQGKLRGLLADILAKKTFNVKVWKV